MIQNNKHCSTEMWKKWCGQMHSLSYFEQEAECMCGVNWENVNAGPLQWHFYGLVCMLQGRLAANQYKVILSVHLHPVREQMRMKMMWAAVPWPPHSPHHNPTEHLWVILHRRVRDSTASIMKTPAEGMSFGGTELHPSSRATETLRIQDTVHWSCSGSTLY